MEAAHGHRVETGAVQVKGNTLDLVLTNIPHRVLDVEDLGRLGTSDHSMIQLQLSANKKGIQSVEMVLNWFKADWGSIRRELQEIDWAGQLLNCDTDAAWSMFKDKLNGLVIEHVPLLPRRTNNKPVWMTREVLRAVRQKRQLWKKARCGAEDMARYRTAEKDTARRIRNAERSFETKLAKEKNNSRPFYSYLKGRTKNRATVGPLID